MLLQQGLRVDGGRLVGVDPAEAGTDEEYSRSIYEGRADFPVLYVTQLDEESRLPVAELAVREFGTYVRAIWFEYLPCGRVVPELTYHFYREREADDDMFTPDHGVFRDGHLFVASIQRDVYDDARTAEIGHPYESEKLNRLFSTDGKTRLSHRIRGDLVQQRGRIERVFKDRLVPEGPLGYDWRVDPAVDTSGDGFWEPVPEFGDWERFLVRDRPGVKVVY